MATNHSTCHIHIYKGNTFTFAIMYQVNTIVIQKIDNKSQLYDYLTKLVKTDLVQTTQASEEMVGGSLRIYLLITYQFVFQKNQVIVIKIERECENTRITCTGTNYIPIFLPNSITV